MFMSFVLVVFCHTPLSMLDYLLRFTVSCGYSIVFLSTCNPTCRQMLQKCRGQSSTGGLQPPLDTTLSSLSLLWFSRDINCYPQIHMSFCSGGLKDNVKRKVLILFCKGKNFTVAFFQRLTYVSCTPPSRQIQHWKFLCDFQVYLKIAQCEASLR